MQFLLTLLNIWAPEWEGFTKGYVYRRPREDPIEPEVDNSDQLYDQLPMLSLKELRKSNRMRLPKSERLELKMAKILRAQEKLGALQAKVNQEMIHLHTNRFTFNPEPAES